MAVVPMAMPPNAVRVPVALTDWAGWPNQSIYEKV